MINLIPPELKSDYHFARINRRLLGVGLTLIIGLIGLGILGTAGWVSMHFQIASTNKTIAAKQAKLTSEHQAQVEAEVQKISNDFHLMVKVLSNEVVFSKLLKQMAAAMPQGANLTNLTITDTTGGTGLDITADATDYTSATQVQANLSDPSNGIFSKTDLVSINCQPSSTSASADYNPRYPCSVVLRAEFAKNNQFLFINQGGSSS